jgi:hypothetical protein
VRVVVVVSGSLVTTGAGCSCFFGRPLLRFGVSSTTGAASMI